MDIIRLDGYASKRLICLQSVVQTTIGRLGMKRGMLVVCALLMYASVAVAAPKSYQVTGPVLEVKDDLIIVQKGSEKWEIARDKDTKITGELKVGSKVTVYYTMKAVSAEGKADPKAKADTKADAKTDTKKKK